MLTATIATTDTEIRQRQRRMAEVQRELLLEDLPVVSWSLYKSSASYSQELKGLITGESEEERYADLQRWADFFGVEVSDDTDFPAVHAVRDGIPVKIFIARDQQEDHAS